MQMRANTVQYEVTSMLYLFFPDDQQLCFNMILKCLTHTAFFYRNYLVVTTSLNENYMKEMTCSLYPGVLLFVTNIIIAKILVFWGLIK